MAYQSFPGVRGDSDSIGKWIALQLTERQIKGKDVLDLGCNEGFFCLKMFELGAKSVLGLDYSEKYIERAKTHLLPEHENVVIYRQENWEKLSEYPDNSFDLILCLSAFHYSTSPDWFKKDGHHRLLDNVMRVLRPDGLFVLEVGMIDSTEKNWIPIQRIADVVYHGTRPAMLELLNKTFAKVELKGPSVNQGGDPIPRYVFHCFKTKQGSFTQTVILLTGDPGAGKSTLAEMICEGNAIYNLNVDGVLMTMSEWSKNENLRQMKLQPSRLKTASLEISRQFPTPFVEDFVTEIIEPIKEKVIIADGYTLGIPAIKERLVRRLHSAGYRVWQMNKIPSENFMDSMTPGYPSHALNALKYRYRDEIVDTQSNPAVQELLSSLAASITKGLIVEIGVLGGANLLHLYEQAATAGNRIVGIDPFEKIESYNGIPKNEVDANMRLMTETNYLQNRLQLERIIEKHKLNDIIQLIPETSETAVSRFNDQSIDLLFIDGDHGFHAVLTDLMIYYPKMKQGSLIVVPNTSWKSISSAVGSFCEENNLTSTTVNDCFLIRL